MDVKRIITIIIQFANAINYLIAVHFKIMATRVID